MDLVEGGRRSTYDKTHDRNQQEVSRMTVSRITRVRICCLAVLLAGWACSLLAAGEVDFLRDVKPILVTRCYRCHSSLEQEGGLRLDSAAAIAKGGDQGV